MHKKQLGLLAILTATLGMGGTSSAAVLTVPAQYNTIESALDASSAGDEVQIAPGIYQERDLVLPVDVSIRGMGSSPLDVVIDAQNMGRILYSEFSSNDAEISNLSFHNGKASGKYNDQQSGGAIVLIRSHPTITECIFKNNFADGSGGAIRCFNSSPIIHDSVFELNEARDGGGAIDCTFRSEPWIQNCEFKTNHADWGGGLSCRDYSSALVIESRFYFNVATGLRKYGGGAFSDYDSAPRFNGCTFYGNRADLGGALANFADSGSDLTQCTITGNQADQSGGGVYTQSAAPSILRTIITFQGGSGVFSEGDVEPVVANSNLFGNIGGDWIGKSKANDKVEGYISLDPEFCASQFGQPIQFHIQDSSPCAPANNDGEIMGAWSVGCETTATFLSSLTVGWAGSSAAASWRILAADLVPEFRLTATQAGDPEGTREVPYFDAGDGLFRANDSLAGRAGYGDILYQLFMLGESSQWELVNEYTLKSLPSAGAIIGLSAYPNPFNPRTTISFTLDGSQRARIRIYNMEGRLIRMLADEEFGVGEHSRIWDGMNDDGVPAGSGTYMVLVEGEIDRQTRKLTLLK